MLTIGCKEVVTPTKPSKKKRAHRYEWVKVHIIVHEESWAAAGLGGGAPP
jgi:hypothetical protein